MAQGPRIALLIDGADWHAERLKHAFAARGVEAQLVSLTDCAFDSDNPTGLTLPGFDRALPDGVFVRCVPGGSFEQVTRRLGILHALDALGVPLCNGPRAIERCVDKSTTTFFLQRAGLPTPPTWAVESDARAHAIVAREVAAGHSVVLKPLFGSQGRGLLRLERAEDLPAAEDFAGVYYLQRYVEQPDEGWRDWRVLVAGERALAAMERRGSQWITNIHQGAAPEAVALEEPMAGLAVAAARAVGAGYAGIDIIRDAEGRYLVLEINSMPAWSGLQKVTALDLSQALADSFLNSLSAGSAAQGSPAPLRVLAGA